MVRAHTAQGQEPRLLRRYHRDHETHGQQEDDEAHRVREQHLREDREGRCRRLTSQCGGRPLDNEFGCRVAGPSDNHVEMGEG